MLWQICHYIDCLHLCIIDMIHVGNNTESQLEDLLSRRDSKCIWDLASIAPYGLNQDDGFYCQNKRCLNQSINRIYFQTKCEQSKQININQISLIIIMHW